METNALITQLARTASPVRPLRSPMWRTAAWLLLSAPYIALVVLMMSPRGDLAMKAYDPFYVVETLAALATGITAALAAFSTIIPGRSRSLALLPLLPFGIWLASLGYGCVQSWLLVGPGGIILRPDWICFPAIALVGAVPAIGMAIMLRRGAPLTPHLSTLLGGLAAAGLGNFGLRLFHAEDASWMVLVWQLGSVVLLSVLAGRMGGLLLRWPSLRKRGAGV